MEGCSSNFGKVFRLLGLAACITVVSSAGMAQSVKNSAPVQKGPAVKDIGSDGSQGLTNERTTSKIQKPQAGKGGVTLPSEFKADKGNPFTKPSNNPAFGLGKTEGAAAVERGGSDGTNDCGTGSNISGAGSFPYSTAGATTDGVGHAACLFFGSNQIFNDVWFNWTATVTGTVTINTCGSSGDSKIALYGPGAACPPTDADLLACNDDFCGLLSQLTAVPVTSGNVYKLRVGTFGAAGTSSGTITITQSGGGGGGGGNDNCASATPIGDGSFPFTTVGATTDGPAESICLFFGDSQVGQDIWFLYTASCDGQGTASLCGSGYDTKVAIYAGSTCPTSESAIACNDDFCGLQSQVSFPTTMGSQYLVRVGGYTTATGSGTLTMSCLSGSAPANDSCASAATIACGDTATVDNTFASVDPSDPFFDCSFGGPQQGFGTVWYRFQATANSATASTCNSAASDTMIQILDGSCGSFTALACNDDACGPNGLRSSATATGLTVGNFYYIEVASWNAAGVGGLEVSLTCSDIQPCSGTPEGEPNCGLDGQGINGGCNSTPPAFSPIVCGQTYCGSGGADGTFRDTDWYEVTGPATEYTWTVNASFNVLVGIVNNGGIPSCAGVSAFLVFATGAPFADVAVTACVPAGTWWPFVAPNTFSGVTCESPYTATLTCVPCDAGTPPNDNCSGAIALSLPADVTGNTQFATADPGLPACGTSITAPGVWYSVIGDGSTITASTCNPGTGYDTKLHAFCGNCDAGQWVCLAGDDDACGFPPGHSTVSFCTNPGQVYYIFVHGFGGGVGTFQLTVSSDGVNCGGGVSCSTSGPPNDLCADAELIACGDTVNGNNQFGTTSGDDPIVSCRFGGPGAGFNSIWYRFQATANSASVDLCASSAGDTMLQILSGSCGSFTELACNDDSCGLLSQVTATGLTVGNFYYICVTGYDVAGTGPITLTLSCTDIEPCVGTPEGEPNCGLDGQGINGGCNSTPPAFSPISCGQTYCGSGGADGTFRDTDWYEVTFGSGTEMTWTVNASFNVLVGIVNNGGVPSCAGVSSFLVFATGAPFSDTSVVACVAPGTWWPFVAPNTFSGVACESPYEATLTCVPCVTTAPENDTCDTATAITSIPAVVFGDTTFAGPDGAAPFCGTSISAPGIWYTVVGNGQTIRLNTCQAGTTYDTKLNVYCGSCSNLICITGNDDVSCPQAFRSEVTWCSESGTTYYILVQGFGGATGAFEMLVDSLGTCTGAIPCSGGGPSNNDCANCTPVGEGTFSFSTFGATTDGPDEPALCSFFGDSQVGCDIWYCYTAGCTGETTVSLCGSGYDTKVAIYAGFTCPTSSAAIACNDDFCGLQSQVTFPVVSGGQYLIRVGGYGGATGCATGTGTMAITCGGACVVTCPPNGVAEPEPCDIDTISGCNSMPPAFIPIACEETVCGHAWATGSLRDTDWYQLDIVSPNSRNVTWTVTAEFPVLIGIVENGGIPNCAGVSAFRVFATAGPCQTVSVNSLLPSGSWWMFVATSSFGGTTPCSAASDYVAHLDCGFSGGCPGDADGDGDVDLHDVAIVIANWGNPGGPGDVTGNGIVGIDDIALIIKWWACGL